MIEVLVAFVGSHIGGMAIGGVLGRNNLFGFGLKAIELAAQRRAKRRHERARNDLESWLSENTGSE